MATLSVQTQTGGRDMLDFRQKIADKRLYLNEYYIDDRSAASIIEHWLRRIGRFMNAASLSNLK